MARLNVSAVTLVDLVDLAANMRASDAREMRAYGGGRDTIHALLDATLVSMMSWAVRINGELVAVFGCAPINLLTGQGSPWMLATPLLSKHARILVRETPHYIARMLAVFPHLVNFVHTENHASIRWLRRLGFTVHPPVPHGAPGEKFHPFEMRA